MNPSRIYRRLAELPIFTSASFISAHQISLESTVKDHVNNTKRTFIQDVGIPDEFPSPNLSALTNSKVWLSTPVERSESIVGRLISPSGKRTALLRETTSTTPKKRFVEIWRGDYAELIFETTSRHGSFYADATFSSLCFSPKEDALLYTAESNAPEEDPKDPFHKFRFDAQYGEQFIDRRRPTLFWLRWDSPSSSSSGAESDGSESVTKLIQINPSIQHLPKSLSSSYTLEDPPVFSLGQATFASSEGRSILATAYLRTAGDRKLGIVYCTNRPSMIVHLTLPDIPLKKDTAEEKRVGEEKEAEENVSINCETLFSEYPSRSPRVWFPPAQQEETASNSKPLAIWLSSAVEPHGSCSRLHMMELPTAQVAGSAQARTIIDSVWEPPFPVDDGGFPGLYVNQLPANPFLVLKGVLHAVCLSNWGSDQDLIVIRLVDDYVPPALPRWAVPPASYVHGARTHQVFRVMPGGRTSTSLVACDGINKVVVAASSLTEPGEVMVAEVKDGDIGNVKWHRVTHVEERVHDLVSNLEGEAIDIRGHEPAQTIYVKVSEEENQPTITWPHGGPHSVTVAGFSPEAVAFALCGYTISLPNYRGSLGYGQRWVKELLGKIGSLDVQDVIASADQMIEDGYSQKGPGMQLYMGGSHGGFLGAHVIGQYPSFFSAAVLRNPVINIPAMHTTTDIPDWTTVECGISYDPRAVLTPAQYKTMYQKSPIQYVHKVTTPVLLRIGDVDQRVPPSQGREYYHLLKANGMGEKVEMLWYPENGHPLDKLEAERAGWDATLAWFKRYGPPKST